MGLFDFGDKAMVKSIATRVNIGIGVLTNELDRSNGVASITVKGIAGGLKKDIKEMQRIANSLSESSRSSILIKMGGTNVQLPAYFFTLKMISNDCKNAIGFEIFE
jgi:hypothetical protein